MVQRQRLELLRASGVVEAVNQLLGLLVADVVETGEAGPVDGFYLVVRNQKVFLRQVKKLGYQKQEKNRKILIFIMIFQ